MSKVEWLKDNAFQIFMLVISWVCAVVIAYNAVVGRVIILEQKAEASSNTHELIRTELREIKTDIKDIDKKTDEIIRFFIPRN